MQNEILTFLPTYFSKGYKRDLFLKVQDIGFRSRYISSQPDQPLQLENSAFKKQGNKTKLAIAQLSRTGVVVTQEQQIHQHNLPLTLLIFPITQTQRISIWGRHPVFFSKSLAMPADTDLRFLPSAIPVHYHNHDVQSRRSPRHSGCCRRFVQPACKEISEFVLCLVISLLQNLACSCSALAPARLLLTPLTLSHRTACNLDCRG